MAPPPSGLGNSVMRTSGTSSDKSPRLSAGYTITARWSRNSAGSLVIALGAKLSAPSPVVVGNVLAALEISLPLMSGNSSSLQSPKSI